jgi:Xaa-Pro aminopeptidase
LTPQQKKFHSSRRKIFSGLIGKNSIAVIFSSNEKNKSFDENYRFKQNNSFFYLTGFKEPFSALVIAPSGFHLNGNQKSGKFHEALFVRGRDKEEETWSGKRTGFDKVRAETGIMKGYSNKDIDKIFHTGELSKFDRLYVNINEALSSNIEFREFISPFLKNFYKIAAGIEITDASYLLGKMRIGKDNFEIENIKRAIGITIDSFKSAYAEIRPGMFEYEVQAILEYNYLKNGADDLAYLPIVGSGNNTCTLHYEANRERMKNGDLLLIDSGCQYYGYSADITRTIPVSGKYSKEQKEIYSIVLKANKECIKACKPGVKFSELKRLSEKILAGGLRKLKILKGKEKVKKYSLHGLGHHMGLDTHDAVPFGKKSNRDFDVLGEGNIITIEPGLYFPADDKSVPVRFRGTGVRIEDDILITNRGHKNLSEDMPKEIEEVEELIRKDKN